MQSKIRTKIIIQEVNPNAYYKPESSTHWYKIRVLLVSNFFVTLSSVPPMQSIESVTQMPIIGKIIWGEHADFTCRRKKGIFEPDIRQFSFLFTPFVKRNKMYNHKYNFWCFSIWHSFDVIKLDISSMFQNSIFFRCDDNLNFVACLLRTWQLLSDLSALRPLLLGRCYIFYRMTQQF